ncbi:NF2IP-like protein [Mya arenaria]|uniref:NF2IP-like protein n=1 Tax=Mya arenaria TaxID=6604 RepID=A0ABY7E253_MYAAR|nr:NF2IP-like protein [Mya arenaria]
MSEKHQLDSEDDDDEYVYSNCVTNFYKRMRETSLKEQMRLADDDDDEDVEEDLFNMSSSPERNTNSSLLVKSPTPPPSPPKQLPKKARNTKKRKQLQRAMECLSSDIRTAQSELVAANTSADYDVLVLEDEDSEQVTMRVAIQGDIERFTYKMDDPFENMMNMIKGTKACDRVMLVFNDCTISRHDTPRVVGYSVGDIITCHLLNGEESFMEDSHTDTSSDCVEIVVQSNFSRQKEVILAKIKCPMSAVLSEYASRIKTPAEDLVLNFDGDVVDVTLTPEDLEVEAGDIFDVKRNNVVIIR